VSFPTREKNSKWIVPCPFCSKQVEFKYPDKKWSCYMCDLYMDISWTAETTYTESGARVDILPEFKLGARYS
jgi:hypothetical protein